MRGFRHSRRTRCVGFAAVEISARLRRIEDLIGRHRKLYMAATWAGHSAEAEQHEQAVDELLFTWQRITRGEWPAECVAEQTPCGS